MLGGVREEGNQGIVHRLRGQPSNRRRAAKIQARAVRLVKAKFSDFGPRLAAEYLLKDDGLGLARTPCGNG